MRVHVAGRKWYRTLLEEDGPAQIDIGRDRSPNHRPGHASRSNQPLIDETGCH